MHLHVNIKHTFNCIVFLIILVGLSDIRRNAHIYEKDDVLGKT